MINIEIWASGAGSNAEVISKYFQEHPEIRVCRLASNNEKAAVLNMASLRGIETYVFDDSELKDGSYLSDLQSRNVHLIILAGFLKLVPAHLVRAYPQRILNIHPALLPKFGGKNMYGDHVHRAVLEAAEDKTGITIHLVNEQFDEGKIIAQFEIELDRFENLDSLRNKVRKLEHKYFPMVIEQYALVELK
jgi:phosphoribosylglycinamide formyltransferase-1